MNREIASGLAWAAVIIAVAQCARMAQQAGLVEHETVLRIVFCLNGLVVAWYGNRLPKTWVPNVHGRKLTRVSGWAMALSGVVYAALWLFAPVPVAIAGGIGAILAGIAVTFGYCFVLRGSARVA